METIDYEKQATDFLEKTGATMKIVFLKTGKHFDDDDKIRDIYLVTIERGTRKYSFNFGNSIQKSGKFLRFPYGNKWEGVANQRKPFHSVKEEFGTVYGINEYYIKNEHFAAPTPYDVLAALTKYDPGTLENFCSEYGYDTDSKKADKVYQAVTDEYVFLCTLFSDEEMGLMQEIN